MAGLDFGATAIRSRLDNNRIRRGETYASEERVDILAIEDGEVVAIVTGEMGDHYAVTVSAAGVCHCTCPNYPEERVCKHVLAAAIVAEALDLPDIPALEGRLGQVEEGLAFESASALAALVSRLIRTVPGALEAVEGQD